MSGCALLLFLCLKTARRAPAGSLLDRCDFHGLIFAGHAAGVDLTEG
jgi:hypothetical protein